MQTTAPLHPDFCDDLNSDDRELLSFRSPERASGKALSRSLGQAELRHPLLNNVIGVEPTTAVAAPHAAFVSLASPTGPALYLKSPSLALGDQRLGISLLGHRVGRPSAERF